MHPCLRVWLEENERHNEEISDQAFKESTFQNAAQLEASSHAFALLKAFASLGEFSKIIHVSLLMSLSKSLLFALVRIDMTAFACGMLSKVAISSMYT